MMARYGMVIDTVRCIGCLNCAVSCKLENNLPNDVWWNRVLTIGGDELETPGGEFPDNNLEFLPLACQHCENPACTKVCPVGATFKDSETGIVRQDYEKCIGCRMCMAACPYTGVRSFNWEEPRYYIDVAMGSANVPKHQKHVVEKCTFCYHRLAEGGMPACMELCIGRARYYGDFDDPESEVSKLIASRKYKQVLPEQGTQPNVYYLV